MRVACAYVQAQANGLSVAALHDLPKPSTADTPAQPDQAMQQALACLARMLQLSGIQAPWLPTFVAGFSRLSQQPAVLTSAQHAGSHGSTALAQITTSQQYGGNLSSIIMHGAVQPRMPALHQHSTAMQEGSPRHGSKAERRLQREQEQRRQQLAVAELSAAASSFLAFLRMQLQGQVAGWFQQDLEELWMDVLMHKPPWDNLQFVEVLEHHYNSTIKVGWA